MTVINGLWIGAKLSPLERACVQSFLRQGFEFRLYTYDSVMGVPAGCQVLDAATILPANRVFAHRSGVAKGSFATFSNVFRFKLLFEQGGWWMDMDMFCLTNGLPNDGVVVGRQDDRLINDAAMRFPARHPLVEAALLEAQARGTDVEWTEIGPALLTRLIETGSNRIDVFPAQVFYPLHFSEFWAVLDPRRTAHAAERIKSAACLHLWNEMWRRSELDKEILPPDGSLLRNFYEWTIGIGGFEREYVLAKDCPLASIALEIVER